MTDTFDVEAPRQVTLDRSTSELWGGDMACPFRAHAVETRTVTDPSRASDSGIEAHKALSYGVFCFAEDGEFDIGGVRDEAAKARPDVQPDVLQALPFRTLYRMRDILAGHHPSDVARYQGGADEHDGQIAREFGGVTFTQELDFSIWCRVPSGNPMLEVWDFKTGWTPWTEAKVRNAFQFQHANWVLRGEYPTLAESVIWFRVIETRRNNWTRAVAFTPMMAKQFEGRLFKLIDTRKQAMAAEQIEAWPDPDKCVICPTVLLCLYNASFAYGLAENNPAVQAHLLTVNEEFVSDLKKDLWARVKQWGPIDLGNGKFWGAKPTKSKKPDIRSAGVFDREVE